MALRAACISLAKAALLPPFMFDPNSQQLRDSLGEVSRNLPEDISQELGDSVYLPLQYLLQKDTISDSVSLLVLRILAQLFESKWNCDPNKSSQLVSVATYLVSPGPPGDLSEFEKKPEELHEASFRAMHAIFAKVSLPESPALAHVITLILTSLERDKELQTHIMGLKTLIALFSRVLVSPDPKALVLPGTISKLVNFIGQKYGKRHRLAKEMALKVMQLDVCGCMADTLPKSKVRNDSWRAASAHQLARALAIVQRLLQETQFATTIQAVFNFSKGLITQCRKTLDKECIPTVLDLILFCGAQEIDLSVKNEAKALIHVLPSEVLTEAAYNLLDRVPSALASQDESRPLRILQALAECAQSLPTSRVMEVLENSVELSVGNLLKQSPSPQLLLGDAVPRDALLEHVGLKTPLAASTQKAVSMLVSRLEPVEALKWLLDRIPNQGPVASSRLLWFGSSIVRGNPTVQDYFDLLVTCYDLLETPAAPMACHVVGDIALSSTFSTDFLVDGIFPLFRLLGSSSEPTRAQARFALCQFASNQNQTLTELVNANKDYIVDGISRQVNSLDITPATPISLAALVDLGGSAIIPYLDDIVDSLFTLLDLYHGYSQLVQGVLLVFKMIVKAAGKTIPPSLEAPSRRLHFSSYTSLLEELDRKPEIDPSLLENPIDLSDSPDSNNKAHRDEPLQEPEEMIDSPDDTKEIWESPVPYDVYCMLERIATYCDLLLTHSLPEIRVTILEIVKLTIPSLASARKNFLPLVHRLWPQVVSRIQDPEIYVVESALDTISIISEYSGDFVQTRVDALWKTMVGNASKLFRRQWPQFSPERRLCKATAKCLIIWLRLPPSPDTLESMAVTLRSTFQRGDMKDLYLEFDRLYGDLIWTVMLQSPVRSEKENLMDVNPMYIHIDSN